MILQKFLANLMIFDQAFLTASRITRVSSKIKFQSKPFIQSGVQFIYYSMAHTKTLECRNIISITAYSASTLRNGGIKLRGFQKLIAREQINYFLSNQLIEFS